MVRDAGSKVEEEAAGGKEAGGMFVFSVPVYSAGVVEVCNLSCL